MKMLTSFTLGLATLALAASAHAQVMEKKVLTLDGANRVIAAVEAEARKNNAGGVIAVVDDGGNLMALARLDGSFAAGANVAIGKARTAALFQKPTRVFEDIIAKGRTSMVALPDFTPLQGGVPILVGGKIVGAVGVSGANSAQQDDMFATAGANALDAAGVSPAGPAESSTRGVTYFESAKVTAAFAKGMPLVEVANYKVHASRRDGPGMAEVHERDTDIVHVLEGTATLVTGGRADQAKQTAAEEFRGDRIEGGESRRLVPGDVVIIPNGVPHQFLDVAAPFTYYVVKVRSEQGGSGQ